jgi:hypothetical protein
MRGAYPHVLAGEWNSRLKACGQPFACADEAAHETRRMVGAKTIGDTPAHKGNRVLIPADEKAQIGSETCPGFATRDFSPANGQRDGG